MRRPTDVLHPLHPARRLAILVIAMLGAMAACTGDQGSALAYAGRTYLGVDGSVFVIDPARLTDVGRPERINTQGTDGRVYVLPGVPSRDAVVTRGPGEDLTVFVVAADDGRLGSSPLGEAFPDLCPYLADSARDGCPAS